MVREDVDLISGYEQSLVVGACERGNEHRFQRSRWIYHLSNCWTFYEEPTKLYPLQLR